VEADFNEDKRATMRGSREILLILVSCTVAGISSFVRMRYESTMARNNGRNMKEYA
jgi:hypothetical protein